jgi:hypothetical protein
MHLNKAPPAAHRVSAPADTPRARASSVTVSIMLTCYSFVLMLLWTLCTFALTFSNRDPLFSSSYRLFCQNMGGTGYTCVKNLPCYRSLGDIRMAVGGLNHGILVPTYGAHIDAPYHLC